MTPICQIKFRTPILGGYQELNDSAHTIYLDEHRDTIVVVRHSNPEICAKVPIGNVAWYSEPIAVAPPPKSKKGKGK